VIDVVGCEHFVKHTELPLREDFQWEAAYRRKHAVGLA
jgi:hypothetical protein